MHEFVRSPLYRGLRFLATSFFVYVVLIFFAPSAAVSQQPAPALAGTVPAAVPGAVPSLISFGGVLKDAGGEIRSSVTGVTFLLYRDEQGGSPLWMETQNVTPDKTGRYSAQLGTATANGLPADLFQGSEPRWLAVQLAGEAEEPRVVLVAVPYAMKAADATTLGGLPPSAFVLAAPAIGGAPISESANGGVNGNAASSNGVSPSLSGSGTADYLPLWTSSSALGSSVLFQTGSGSAAKIGINTTTPAAMLDVKGSVTIRSLLNLPATATATASAGANSNQIGFVASTYNSGSKTAANQVFRFMAEPAGNNTASSAATLNLLFGTAPAVPAETGLKIASNGRITFASGQTFPGTGPGTITGVTAGADLTGGGTSGAVTLNLDTTKVPLLAAANTFTGNQTVNGNLSATGVVTGSSFQVGSSVIAFGSPGNQSAYLGFSGNTATAGLADTAVGYYAMHSNTTGNENTSVGTSSLTSNTTGFSNLAAGTSALSNSTTGNENTAVGVGALYDNVTGSFNTGVGLEAGATVSGFTMTGNYNTFLGALAQPGVDSITNATAVGAQAEVTAGNSMVLGSITGVNGATASTNVGIGITAPQFALDIHGGVLHVGGNTSAYPNVQGAYLNWNALTGQTGETDFINNQGGGTGGWAFINESNVDGGIFSAYLMFIGGNGSVGIGTTSPDSTLSVNGSADKAGGGSWGTYSDARLKTLHGNFTAGLGEIMKLHPIRYRYKELNAMNINDHDEHVGFVAQDVQRVIPEAVTTNSRGYLMLNNDPILWTMLNAIQQQQGEIRSLRAQFHQMGAVAKPQARRAASAGRSTSKAELGKDQELRRVRAELELLRKKDAGLKDRLSRLEQALSASNPAERMVAASVAMK